MAREPVARWVPAANRLLEPGVRRARHASAGSFDALQARAARRSGVAEPADPGFLADLRVLHDSFMAVPELSFMGLISVRTELLRHLRNWLRVREFLRAHPQVAEVPVQRPVVVVGLPRTGTSLLHALLASAPGHRAALMWELLAPVPVGPGPGAFHPDRRIRGAELLTWFSRQVAPSMRVVHPLDAHGPEECVFALPHSMVYYARARMPGYLDWYARRDATPDYAYLRQQLQILQWDQPPCRWVLKSPFHLWNLGALLRVFPDATIIWTHRDPGVAIASWCSLAEITMTFHNRQVDLRLLGQDWVQLWAQAVARGTAARAAAAAPFLDVPYTQLSAEPEFVRDEILNALGVAGQPWAPEQGTASTLRPARRTHHYSLDRYGLTAQAVHDAFPAGT
jgi:Sulfotransferase family